MRDPSCILIAFVLPGLLLFLIGSGVSLDASDLKIGVVIESSTPEAQSLSAAFQNSPCFVTKIGRDHRKFEQQLVTGELHGIVTIPATFAEALKSGTGTGAIQVLADGSEPNTAVFVQNYAQGVFATWLMQQPFPQTPSQPIRRMVLHEQHVCLTRAFKAVGFFCPGQSLS